MSGQSKLSRRGFIKTAGGGLALAGLLQALPRPVWAASRFKGIQAVPPRQRYDLTLDYSPFTLDGRRGRATAINGTVPGPLIRLREGDEVELNVTNRMMDTKHASLHWHGVLVPFAMDGVPHINFPGILPGRTYHYRYKVKQAGTYWYHSHSRFQEQTGAYGPLIIDPKDGEPFTFDRDYPIVLSDWSFSDPETIFRNINLMGDYYNRQQRTVGDFLRDIDRRGLSATLAERLAWGKMRMSPVDLADVTGATLSFLMNGHSPDMNWTALFQPGETIRLRFINSSATTNYDVRIPGLDMEVVMADGKAVRPVRVHEFRIGVAETYDVLVRPQKDQAFTLFAESLDRSGFARGTLAPRPGLDAAVPRPRPRPVRTMKGIGMEMMKDGAKSGKDDQGQAGNKSMAKGMGSGAMKAMKRDPRIPGLHGPAPFSPPDNANVAMLAMNPRYRLDDPGLGLGRDGWRVLTYQDLVSTEPQPYSSHVDREMTINITSNMERYMFSFDGLKFSQQPGPYLFRHNERLRLFLVNHTMMDHPIHLHGMWMQLENGADKLPFKHTILVKPGEVVSALITPVEKGDWAFHCHLLYHMEAGMFQVVRVA